VVLWALINVVLRIKRSYMITPKGKAAGGGPRAISIYGPYIVLAALPLAAVWLFDASAGSSLIRGYYGLALANAVMGALVLATTLGMDIKQIAADHSALRTAVRSRAVIVVALGCLVALLGLSMVHFGGQAIHSMAA
jgi:cellulose synthase (UDP-forming)